MANCRITTRAAFAALAGVILLAGCGGLDQQPFGPDRTAVPQKGGDPFTVVFSPNTLDRAAKPVAGGRVYTRTATEWFSPATSGGLQVRFASYAGADQVQVKTATFAVAKGSINRKAQVAMTVCSGSTLADVWIRFTPSHVVQFVPPATLALVLRGVLDPAQLRAYHISGGTTTGISAQTTAAGGKEWTVIIKVPGFSRYGMGDDFAPEAGDGF